MKSKNGFREGHASTTGKNVYLTHGTQIYIHIMKENDFLQILMFNLYHAFLTFFFKGRVGEWH